MQCPLCGRETADLIEGSCASCAAQRLPFLEAPDVVDVVSCAHCGRVHLGASWKDLGRGRDERMETVLRSVLEVDHRLDATQLDVAAAWEDERNGVAQVRLRGSLRTEAVERSAPVRVRMKSGACPDCSREMGGYFEATLQVRGSQGTDLDLLPKIEHYIIERLDAFKAEGRPNAFVTEMSRLRNGNDYVMGSHEIARQLASEIAERWGAEQDESTKLFTRKDGRDVFRWTMLARLPPYARGDFLVIDDRLYKLLTFDKRNLYLWDLEQRRKVSKEVRRAKDLKVVGRAEEQRDAIVVSRTGTHAQIMDPVSYQTVDVPADLVPAGTAQVPVFRYEDVLYVVTDTAT